MHIHIHTCIPLLLFTVVAAEDQQVKLLQTVQSSIHGLAPDSVTILEGEVFMARFSVHRSRIDVYFMDSLRLKLSVPLKLSPTMYVTEINDIDACSKHRCVYICSNALFQMNLNNRLSVRPASFVYALYLCMLYIVLLFSSHTH